MSRHRGGRGGTAPDAAIAAVDATALRQLAEDCRAASPRLYRQLRAQLRAAGESTRAAVAAAASSAGSRSIPGAVVVSLSLRAKNPAVSAVSIQVNPRKLRPGHAAVAFMVEGKPDGRGYRHPVFGDRDTWVAQRPRPYFVTTIQAQAGAAEAQIRQVMDDVADQLATGSP